ncbi:MAG: hypothetical protein J7621_06890 [Niastella sp.]|nr:hypothetical protein [Niastella sp.]
MKLILLITALTITCFAIGQTRVAPTAINKTQLRTTVQKCFRIMDSIRFKDPDKLEVENKKLIQLLAKHKEELFKWMNEQDFDFLYIAKSTDNKLCLISWDTRMGGTMIDFASIALYQATGQSVKYTLLKGGEGLSNDENTLMHYDTVHTVITGKGNVYLAHGFGQGSTAYPWQEVRAFRIEDNQLKMPAVFPEKESRLFVAFDTHQFGDDELIPTIKVRSQGKTILYPIATESEGFSGKYQTFILSGSRYVEKK